MVLLWNNVLIRSHPPTQLTHTHTRTRTRTLTHTHTHAKYTVRKILLCELLSQKYLHLEHFRSSVSMRYQFRINMISVKSESWNWPWHDNMSESVIWLLVWQIEPLGRKAKTPYPDPTPFDNYFSLRVYIYYPQISKGNWEHTGHKLIYCKQNKVIHFQTEYFIFWICMYNKNKVTLSNVFLCNFFKSYFIGYQKWYDKMLYILQRCRQTIYFILLN